MTLRHLDAMQLDGLWLDVRYAVRALRRTPAFTTAVLLTLALGVGANSVVFSFLDALVLRPLPIDRPDEVVFVQTGDNYTTSFPRYRDLRDRNRTLAGLAAYRVTPMAIDTGAGAQQAWGYLATGNYFDLLGLRPAAGRFFHTGDDVAPGAAPYAVLSHAYWQQQFNGDPGIVGKTVRINRLPYTVLGVAPPGFHGTEVIFRPDLWVPMMMQAQIEGRSWLEVRNTSNTMVIGRLRPGTSREQAEADLTNVATVVASEHRERNASPRVILVKPGLIGTLLRGPTTAFAAAVMALATLVLFAACANLASLLTVRTMDRVRELAIRLSVGATQRQIVRQLGVEVLLICLLGGALGIALASLLLTAFGRWRAPLPFIQVDASPRPSTIVFGLAATLVVALLATLAPARRVTRSDPAALVRHTPGPAGRRRWSSRDLILGGQAALCCVLVTASLVSARGLMQALSMPVGLDPRGLVSSSFDLGLAGYTTDEGRALQQRAIDTIRSLPGVTEAAYASAVPLTVDQSTTGVYAESPADLRRAAQTSAAYYHVSPGYFRVVRTRVLAGREFSDLDTPTGPRVAIVNETFARRVIGTADAVGRRFRVGPGPEGLREVVGVVEDGKYFALSEAPRATVFWPANARYSSSTVLIVRSALADAEVVTQVRRAIRKLDPNVPLIAEGPLSASLGFAFLPARAASIALGAFGVLALTLAVIGMHGLAAHSVTARIHEIGVRVAIGAPAHRVLTAVLGRTAVVLGAGAFAGIAAAVAGVTATWVPAHRAISIDPVRTLRAE